MSHDVSNSRLSSRSEITKPRRRDDFQHDRSIDSIETRPTGEMNVGGERRRVRDARARIKETIKSGDVGSATPHPVYRREFINDAVALTNGAVQRPIRPREKSHGARARSHTLRPPVGLNRTRAQSRQRCTCVCVARARLIYVTKAEAAARATLCARPPRGERRSSLVRGRPRDSLPVGG